MYRIAYFGSPDFSASVLADLIATQGDDYTIELVFTPPPKPSGRGLEPTMCPVEAIATQSTIPVSYLSPKVDAPQVISLLHTYKIDLGLIFAYGQILPQDVLDAVTNGFVNIHPSSLPQYRGPNPITYPLLFGETSSSISLIRLSKRMDAGNILLQSSEPIPPTVTEGELIQQYAHKAPSLIRRMLSEHLVTATGQVQDEMKATYTLLLSRQDGYITDTDLAHSLQTGRVSPHMMTFIARYLEKNKSLSSEPFDLFNVWRALTPWPGLWTLIHYQDKRIRCKILTMTRDEEQKPRIVRIQIEGRSPQTYAQFLQAHAPLDRSSE